MGNLGKMGGLGGLEKMGSLALTGRIITLAG